MALDNPSYFSIGGVADATFSGIKQMGNVMEAASTSSSDSSPRQLTPPISQDRKRSIRNLLRSVSTNSADSNQELLIMGEPRLSDIAPELTTKYPVEPRRANSLKSTKSDPPRSEVIYSPLATSEDIGAVSDASDDEEVFLNEDSARYYNITAKAGNAASHRRHSISAFISGRERSISIASSSKSFKEDFPQAIVHATPDGTSVKPNVISIDDHSLRHGSYSRKRCNRCPRGPGKRSADMDDILIISVKESSAANLWVEYFTSYFEQISKHADRKPYKIHHLGIEDVIDANGDVRLIAEKTAGVKLQLIILCPTLLEKITENLQFTASLSKIILADRILALQLGTTDDDVTDIHKNALCGFSQWQRRSVGQDQDENFANDFVTTAMAIFSKIWKQQSSVATEENSQFSVSPKKIRQGQTSVLIMLTYPLQKEDILKITVVKNDELTEIKSVKRRNPYTLKITIPDKFLEVSAIVNILVEKNGSFIGRRPIKCESRLRELEQILRSSNNPVEFMCQTLGFSPHDTEQLDNWMVHMFQKNVPPNFNLFINHDTFTSNKHVCEEFPTLLHFAARFGLEKLTAQLLDCPGGDMACEIRNANDLVPADIADNSGHKEIAQMLRGYMKMNEFTTMYTKLKYLTTDSTESPAIEDEEQYLTPKMEDFYKICPAPRPFVPKTPSPLTEEPAHYLSMHVKSSTTIDQLHHQQPLIKVKTKHHHHASQTSIHSGNSRDTEKHKNPALVEDKVQIELAEIMNDFKNNVHTIAQTEQLVAEWQNRNDVQKSFKEKQEQLRQMRLKYEQIQRDMKANTKKASPFERIKKIFAWGSSKEESLDVGYPQNPQKNEISLTGQRPISSLSLQSTTSSVSSGRMSTISGCSLGDSGTHSDHEDRKTILNIHGEEDFRGDNRMGSNYMIPPAPKPVKAGMFLTKNMFPTIEERPPQPTPRPEVADTTDSYYIQFPPNGLPIEGLKFEENDIDKHHTIDSEEHTGSPTQEYVNFPVQGPSSESNNHEYMNFKVPK